MTSYLLLIYFEREYKKMRKRDYLQNNFKIYSLRIEKEREYLIFQELFSIPNKLIPVFQKEPLSGWPEYNTQSTSKPQSEVKQLDRLVQTTTHVTPSTTFLSAIKISAVQTQATSANSSTTVTSSKKRTKTADTIAKKQPRKQFIRETFSPATPLEVNIPKTNSTVPNILANTTTSQSS